MNKITSKTRKAFLAAGLLSGAALSSIVLAAPASAAPLCTTFNTLSALAGNTCTQGVWDFFLPSIGSFAPLDAIQFTGGGNSFSYVITAEAIDQFNVGPYNLVYTVTATAPGKYFSAFTAQTSATVPPLANNTGSYKITSTNAPGTATGMQTGATSITGSQPYSTQTFLTDSFTSVLTVTGGKIQGVQGTIILAEKSSTVPGPLPLLGAGAAFGFSRRIRSRIKASA